MVKQTKWLRKRVRQSELRISLFKKVRGVLVIETKWNQQTKGYCIRFMLRKGMNLKFS